MGTPLSEVTFVVLDLETTGGQSHTDSITEIGAVKVRGGAHIGTFQTLVDPGVSIPAFITRLTGISDAMVRGQPRIDEVLGSLLEFIRNSVVVAHNAPFDVGFLRAAAQRHAFEWPAVPVLDTVRLARALIPAGTVANHKLGTLASFIGTEVTPNHRAFDDASATSDVLHYLIEIAGGQGAHTFDAFAGLTTKLHRLQRAKQHLAHGVPEGPGVYRFLARDDEPLYIGMSGNLAFRVANYFTASEKRARMMDLLAATERIETERLPTRLEAAVVESRLLRSVKPPYNALDKESGTQQWLRITPQGGGYGTAVARVHKPAGIHVGPYGQRQDVLDAAAALDLALPDASFAQVESALNVDSRPLVEPLRRAMLDASELGEYERAGAIHRHVQSLLKGAKLRQQLVQLAGLEQIVAAERGFEGTWDIALIRHGLLIATERIQRGDNPHLTVARLLAEHPVPDAISPVDTLNLLGASPPMASAGTGNERRIVARWLSGEAVRLVQVTGTWDTPALANFEIETLLK